jgi:hypothetical protein
MWSCPVAGCRGTEGTDLGVLSGQPIVLFGPGSEWFWSMAQFVVVAITLMGIYLQFRQSRAANAFAQANAMKQDWEGERMVRSRLALYRAVADGGDLSVITVPIGNFWENIGALVRAGHIELPVVWEYLGSSCRTTWGLIDGEVRRVQAEEGTTIWQHFVWLNGELERLDRLHGDLQERYTRAFLMPQLPRFIASMRATLDTLEAMRTALVTAPEASPAVAVPSSTVAADTITSNHASD